MNDTPDAAKLREALDELIASTEFTDLAKHVAIIADALQEAAWRERHESDIRAKLREFCGDYGDNDWPDDLHLGDVLEKHLMRHVWAREEEAARKDAENARLRDERDIASGIASASLDALALSLEQRADHEETIHVGDVIWQGPNCDRMRQCIAESRATLAALSQDDTTEGSGK